MRAGFRALNARQQIALLDLVIDIGGSDQRLEIGTDPGEPIRRVRETFDGLVR